MRYSFEVPKGDGTLGYIKAQQEGHAITVSLSGTGMHDLEPGDESSGIIYIEFYGGKPRVIVWGDINSPDPTHVIELEGALESNRDSE